MSGVRLIAGLGNPGPRYRHTRHNIGADYVEWLAGHAGIRLASEPRFKARVGRGRFLGEEIFLMIPDTFVNLSGESVSALQRFYKLQVDEVLVAYDEVDFDPGVIRLKSGGGAGGHNGIRSIISCLGNEQGFLRLRIGVGHPGDKERMVAYLTSERMPDAERECVQSAWRFDDQVYAHMFAGELQKAMTLLHAPKPV
jgi:PTH1 family peptidyl-tRNA hydrolase